MDPNSVQLRTNVMEVLSDIPESVHFELAGFTVSPTQLLQVKLSIMNNAITVLYNKNLPAGICCYFPLEDRLEASFASAKSLPEKAILVHEAVHALMDMLSIANSTFVKTWKVVDSEAAAYIAQAIYVYVKNANTGRLTSPDPDTDAVLNAAWNVAMSKKPELEKIDSVAGPVKAAISAHPLYKKNANKFAKYNGVPLCIGASSCAKLDE